MIVSCPTCSTHYSHLAESPLELGRCSKCDTRFPLSAQKRRYVVMPAAPANVPDPLLAAGAAEQTQLDLPTERAGAPATELPAGRFVDEPAELPAPSAPATEDADEDGFFGTGMNDDEALFGIDDGDPAEQAARAAAPASAAAERPIEERKPTHPIREALGVFLLAGLGGAAGFHGSSQFGFEPLNAVAAGLGVGLTLGWAWIRWAERKR